MPVSNPGVKVVRCRPRHAAKTWPHDRKDRPLVGLEKAQDGQMTTHPRSSSFTTERGRPGMRASDWSCALNWDVCVSSSRDRLSNAHCERTVGSGLAGCSLALPAAGPSDTCWLEVRYLRGSIPYPAPKRSGAGRTASGVIRQKRRDHLPPIAGPW